MTNVNYNSGEWYGWNGGECPVHPESVVEAVLVDRTNKTRNFDSLNGPECMASDLEGCWEIKEGYRHVIAFRVISEHKEPREFWLYYNRQIGDWLVASDEDSARMLHYPQGEIIHVREVVE